MRHKKTNEALGPIQLLVIEFDEGAQFRGEILKELERLRRHDVVRVVDLLLVRKDADGNVERLVHSDLSLEEAQELGALIGALIGFGAGGEEGATIGAVAGAAELADGHVFDDAETWYVADAIPDGTSAALVLLEHRWAIPLRDAIRRANGFHVADGWIHPLDLVAIGVMASEEAAQLTTQATDA